MARLKLALLLTLITGTLSAQFYFGRNKIQYDHFDWQVMETEHFNLYYYAGEEIIAQSAAYFAEEAFAELERKFNYTLNSEIPLVIYSTHIHFQQTNILSYHIPEGVGGFFEYIKKRVVIPFTGDMYDFRHVIRHELVHVFTHAKLSRVSNDLGLWESMNFPLWFIEGLAELWSTEWDAQAEMVIRDALLYDRLYPLESEALYRSGFLLYKEGQSFLKYIEETYGTAAIRRIMEEYWRYDIFEDLLSGVLGKSYEDVTLDWKLSLKKSTAQALNEDKILPNGENKLTKRGINTSPYGYVDQNGDHYFVFISSRNGYSDIFSQQLGNGDKKPERVVKGERQAARESLHILQTGISVSSQGILAYVTKSGPRDVIRLVDLAQKKEIDSFSHADIVTIRTPRWNNTGDQIVFSAQRFSGQKDIYLWDIAQKKALPLTNDIFDDTDPCFNPAGDLLVFSSNRNNSRIDATYNLFLINTDGQELTQITFDSVNSQQPSWTSDAPGLIYYLSDESATANIWKLDISALNTSGLVRKALVTNFHSAVEDFSILNSDTVLITTFQQYSFQIHQLDLPDEGESVAYKIGERPFSKSWDTPDFAIINLKKRKPYKLDYSLDLAQTAVAYDPIYGMLGGAQLGISDLLGNRYYHFLVTNTAGATSELMGRFNVAITMVDLTNRANRAWSVFHFADDYYNPYEAFYFERSMGFRLGINYPLDVFHRIELSGTLWHSEKDDYFGNIEKAYLVSSFVSFIHDNALWGSTGPVDGWRLRITLGPTFDFKRSSIYNYNGLLDLRWYYRIRPLLTFAQRSMVWANDGEDISRYYIGGSWGLRGYPIGDVYGRKLVMFNQELRFPFASSLVLNFRKTGIGVAPINGACFFDAGNAWDYAMPDLIGSWGFGLRGLFLGGLVLRLDIGKRTDFHSVDQDWFVQFFFGWDY